MDCGKGEKAKGREDFLTVLSNEMLVCFKCRRRSLLNQHSSPFRNLVGVALKEMSIYGAVKKLREMIVNGVVIYVSSVNKRNRFFGVYERLVVARNNFGDWDFMSTCEITLSDPCYIYCRI